MKLKLFLGIAALLMPVAAGANRNLCTLWMTKNTGDTSHKVDRVHCVAPTETWLKTITDLKALRHAVNARPAVGGGFDVPYVCTAQNYDNSYLAISANYPQQFLSLLEGKRLLPGHSLADLATYDSSSKTYYLDSNKISPHLTTFMHDIFIQDELKSDLSNLYTLAGKLNSNCLQKKVLEKCIDAHSVTPENFENFKKALWTFLTASTLEAMKSALLPYLYSFDHVVDREEGKTHSLHDFLSGQTLQNLYFTKDCLIPTLKTRKILAITRSKDALNALREANKKGCTDRKAILEPYFEFAPESSPEISGGDTGTGSKPQLSSSATRWYLAAAIVAAGGIYVARKHLKRIVEKVFGLDKKDNKGTVT